jgi:hypothetical protein
MIAHGASGVWGTCVGTCSRSRGGDCAAQRLGQARYPATPSEMADREAGLLLSRYSVRGCDPACPLMRVWAQDNGVG